MQIYPNHITVKINDEEYTDKCPFPVTFNQLLDKQLDEFTLELLQIDNPIFKPITTVIITVWNGKYPIEQYPEKALKLRYIITSCKSNEIPAGSGKYNHQLALIEETKYLECFIVRSCGFVNPLLKEYTQIAVEWETISETGDLNPLAIPQPTPLKTPIQSGIKWIVPTPSSVFADWANHYYPHQESLSASYNGVLFGKTTIDNNGDIVVFNEDMWDKSPQYYTPKSGMITITIALTVWEYETNNPPLEGDYDWIPLKTREKTIKTILAVV